MGKYDANCAFSGQMPHEVLEAAHLYSYAKVGDHQDEGGILLRRDLHRLFDLGKIAVRKNGLITVHNSLRPYPLYNQIDGNRINIEPTDKQRGWFGAHREMWQVDVA